jgi:8-oxo-dGTP pyrophosphatase MutT (NUDIX family)
MKRASVILVVVVLLLVAGCDKPYLPGDFAEALDLRIAEIERAKELYPAAECNNVLTKQLEWLEELQEASR